MPHSTHPKLDVIAVGAHPDDIEIACGGTLARLVDAGHQVGIIDLTDGEPTPLSPGPETRLAEAQAAAKVLGVARRVTLDLPNRRLFDSFEARCSLAIEFRKYRPRLVIGLGDRTPMASPDHWQAMQITDAAVFYARLTKWDEHFEHLPVHTIEALNKRHTVAGGHPAVIYSRTPLTITSLVALYRLAHFCIVSSLHDGMNLVAKEFVASRDDEHGVLVLSALAGAAQELQDALIINPYDVDGFADALIRAIEMPYDERMARMRAMRRTVAGRNVFSWASDVLEGLESLWSKPLHYMARGAEDAPV